MLEFLGDLYEVILKHQDFPKAKKAPKVQIQPRKAAVRFIISESLPSDRLSFWDIKSNLMDLAVFPFSTSNQLSEYMGVSKNRGETPQNGW